MPTALATSVLIVVPYLLIGLLGTYVALAKRRSGLEGFLLGFFPLGLIGVFIELLPTRPPLAVNRSHGLVPYLARQRALRGRQHRSDRNDS